MFDEEAQEKMPVNFRSRNKCVYRKSKLKNKGT